MRGEGVGKLTRKDMGPRGRGVCFGLALNKVGGGRGGKVVWWGNKHF